MRISNAEFAQINLRDTFGQSGESNHKGYAILLNSNNGNPNKTGSLAIPGLGPVRSVQKSAAPPDQWFTVEATARGNHIIVEVNGQVTADYTDPQQRFARGHITVCALNQVRAAQRYIEFRDFKLEELPVGKGDAPSKIPLPYRTVNLLKLVDPARDTIRGTWSFVDGSLVSTEGAGIEIPYDPPKEYDYRLVFVPTFGKHVMQICRGGGRQFGFIVGGWGNTISGFDMIRGQRANGNPTTATADHWLIAGQRYVLIVKVRKDSVEGWLDDRMVAIYKTDWTDMSLFENLTICTVRTIAIGILATLGLRVESATVFEVTGEGRVLRQPATEPGENQKAEALAPEATENARGANVHPSEGVPILTSPTFLLAKEARPWRKGIRTHLPKQAKTSRETNKTPVIAGTYLVNLQDRMTKETETEVWDFHPDDKSVWKNDIQIAKWKEEGARVTVEFSNTSRHPLSLQSKGKSFVGTYRLKGLVMSCELQKVREVDLLKLVDPAQDAVSGKWAFVNGALVCGSSRITHQIPYDPPLEYDYNMIFVPEDGRWWADLPRGGKQFNFVAGTWGNTVAGFDLIGGQGVTAGNGLANVNNPTATKAAQQFVVGQRNFTVVRVRKNRVEGLLNGRLIASRTTDWTDMSLPPGGTTGRMPSEFFLPTWCCE